MSMYEDYMIYEDTNGYQITHFTWVDHMVYELHPNKTITKKRGKPGEESMPQPLKRGSPPPQSPHGIAQ